MLRPTRPQMPLPGSDFLSKSAGSSPFIGIRRMDAHTLTPQISITAEDEFIEQGGCVGGVAGTSSGCVLSVVTTVRRYMCNGCGVTFTVGNGDVLALLLPRWIDN